MTIYENVLALSPQEKTKLLSELVESSFSLQRAQKKTQEVLKKHILWTKEQLHKIMTSLDQLQAPESSAEIPALTDLKSKVEEIDEDLSIVWNEIFPQETSGGYSPSPAPRP